MAKEETDIVHRIMLDTSKLGARLWKNVRGEFFTKPEVYGLIDAAKSLNPTRILKACRQLRRIKAGLMAADSSDLIGFRPVLITQDMVGSTLPVFTALEVKTETGAVRKGQSDFCDFIAKNGGFSGICRSTEDAKKIMQYPLD